VFCLVTGEGLKLSCVMLSRLHHHFPTSVGRAIHVRRLLTVASDRPLHSERFDRWAVSGVRLVWAPLTATSRDAGANAIPRPPFGATW
jgi:hypothetical protein